MIGKRRQEVVEKTFLRSRQRIEAASSTKLSTTQVHRIQMPWWWFAVVGRPALVAFESKSGG
jgi:hypothetical protein